MVEIYRPGSASERFIDAPSEIAARILPFTVTDDVKPAGQIDSKFGSVNLGRFRHSRAQGNEQRGAASASPGRSTSR